MYDDKLISVHLQLVPEGALGFPIQVQISASSQGVAVSLQGRDLHVDGHVALRLQLHGQALLLQARLQARQDGRHLPRALRQVAAQLARAGLHACRSWEDSGAWLSKTKPRHTPSAGRPQVRLSASWACERPAVSQGRACQAL